MISSTGVRSQDVRALASLHRKAFPDFFLSSLGEHFLVQFYRSFLDDPASVAVVVRSSSGTPAGVAVGTTDPVGFYSRLVRKRWLAFSVAAARSAISAPRLIPRLLRAVTYRGDTHGTFPGALLSSICVDPIHQGTGLGRILEASWTQAVADRGLDAAYLTTDNMNNKAANSFYQAQGWELAGSYTTREGRLMNRYMKNLRRQADFTIYTGRRQHSSTNPKGTS